MFQFDLTGILNPLEKTAKAVSTYAKLHAPEGLIVAGIGGYITSLYLMYKKSPDMHEDIENQDWKQLAKDAAPVAGATVLSTVAVVGGMKEGSKRYAAMSAAYALADEALIDRKNAELTALGKKKVDQIDQSEAENAVANNPPTDAVISDTHTGTCLHYDTLLKHYFRADVSVVDKAIENLSKCMLQGEYGVTLSEFYEDIGDDVAISELSDDRLLGTIGWMTGYSVPEARRWTINFPEVEPVRVLKWEDIGIIGDYETFIRL